MAGRSFKDDRQVTTVTPPPAKRFPRNSLFPEGENNAPDWSTLKEFLQREGRLKKEDCLDIIHRTTAILATESNLVRVQDPITVVGDIHGQFYDLVKLLEVGGDPHSTQYLFLGDYVDRGSFSLEVLLLLFSLKISYPKRIWLLRGNHECRQMTAFFNFRAECKYKYDSTIYDAFMDSFDALPIAALINGRFLALHGGISPDMRTLTQISNLHRFSEPPRSGLFCDILWADPVDENKPDLYDRGDAFYPNDVRGCSYFFGYRAACDFLDKAGLLSIIRAHEAQLEGYKMNHSSSKTGFPTVITIFSAPNYCDIYNNKGAILKFENNTLNIQQFNFSPHPYHLPNFMDIFSWSIPFLTEKVTEILYNLMNSDGTEDDESLEKIILPPEVERMMRTSFGVGKEESEKIASYLTADFTPSVSSQKSLTALREREETIRTKVQTVGRLMRVFRTLREENELVVQLKDCTPAHRIPVGLLVLGKQGLANHLEEFNNAKKIDAVNERWPVAEDIFMEDSSS
ncbi:protein phosphatase 2B catalytic subunit, calcineurin family phosphatse superfamily protein [Cardiosporidium cionae]|uniref:Serine/threonine-protein phosphatase n=1 Tax=Cardiosporidium cionae TaxID=476202 RepID=A0ABQ7JFN2_9APIC|nr:protein phosphatase 2B catalytic subunit, calcineurin family phosphatse superfamily protein [Cardiosporidium cionae]|eukprot:KAF8822830.1 protein phosphatase 2B catalytic subunit, calcineurin family phosphatse superfamily protein [Cardiosporidium cionae]